MSRLALAANAIILPQPPKVVPVARLATAKRNPSHIASIVALKKLRRVGQFSTGQSNGPNMKTKTVAAT